MEMPKTLQHEAKSDRGLAVPIIAALAVKAVALTVIYLAFFTPPPSVAPAASAVLGMPAR